jgi:hypothetical protein
MRGTAGKRWVAGIAVVALTLLAGSVAGARSTQEGYEKFAGCPSPEENRDVETCFAMPIRGGHLKIGNKNIPIEHPFNLSGGLSSTDVVSANSKGGLAPVKQEVPGGILGLTGLSWLSDFFDQNELKLYATTELAGNPENPLTVAFTLPIQIHLVNSLLSDNCKVGSPSAPIKLKLKRPLREIGLPRLSHNVKGTFVDNSFAVPPATNCLLNLFGFISTDIGGVINLHVDLPYSSGVGEAALEFDAESVKQSTVYP